MDDLNVHHFWGVSPAVDLLALSRPLGEQRSEPLRILQLAPSDARHTITTLSRLGRHSELLGSPVHFYIYEEEPEGLARHLMILSVLLDVSLVANERVQVLLELHGNALLRDKTAAYLDQRGQALESMFVALMSGVEPRSAEVAALGEDIACIAKMVDVSLLKHHDKDAIVEAFHKYRIKVEYDMVKAWDARCRKWYGDRYDFKKNMIDWDYHMRLLTAGALGQDPGLGSIVHFHHFRHWRAHGVAYELRDSSYSQPNRSLLSVARGRTKEFKDRSLKDVGRSVSAWGYWGDILNSPYHAFGAVCEERSFFASSNKQFSRTAVDIAEYNVMAILQELRSGTPYAELNGEAHRAKVARGPTSLEDLQDEAQKTSPALLSAIKEEAVQEEASNPPSPSAADGLEVNDSSREEMRLRGLEAEADAAARQRMSSWGVRLFLASGDLVKSLTGRAKLQQSFDAVSLGCRMVHLAGPQHQVFQVAKPGSKLVVEAARYMLQLNNEQVLAFHGKMEEIAGSSGWCRDKSEEAEVLGHLLFRHP